MLAILVGCGLWRAELVALRVEDFQISEEHCVIVALSQFPVGLNKRSTSAAEINSGIIFRGINLIGKIWGGGLTPKAVWHVVKAGAPRRN